MKSLRGRVALAAGAVLAAFILLTSVALEQAFRESARSAREERLLGQLFLLMAAADLVEGGALVFPESLAEPRFSLPGSGLYAQVADAAGQPVWRSPSGVGMAVPFPGSLSPGERRFEALQGPNGKSYFVESFGVSWATGSTPRLYTFSVAEDLTEFSAQVNRFRRSLAAWLGGMALLLLAALWLALRWGLGPLRRVAAEVAAVEAGRQEGIPGHYPAEIQALTDNLNALLAHERARQKRLANAMGDLAHSLKTPLAVMRGALDDPRLASGPIHTLREQIARMDNTVAYHLQRAVAGAPARLARPVAVGSVATKLAGVLGKVYRDKRVQVDLRVAQDLVFRGIEGDLTEVLGNLLDNAHKWCRSRVRLSAARSEEGLTVTVEDDGPGIDSPDAQRLLERGVRADESVPGHGIGLSVVREIVEAYDGRLLIDRSDLGGARVQAILRA